MWHVRINHHRRIRVRWLPIVILVIVFICCVVLYRSLSIDYDQVTSSISYVLPSKSPFLYDIEHLERFLQRTPVKYNYHLFYYPW
jgi:hypothetical protein